MEQIINNSHTILPLKLLLSMYHPKTRGSQDPMDNVTSFFAPLSLSTLLASIALIFKCPLFEWKPRIFRSGFLYLDLSLSGNHYISISFLPYVKQKIHKFGESQNTLTRIDDKNLCRTFPHINYYVNSSKYKFM